MPHKPDIPPEMMANWQCIVDLMASISHAPAGLIMRFEQDKDISVFVSSATDGNVWVCGEKCAINSGLYCEEVIKTGKSLLVPDALVDPRWDHNPDLKHDMRFYLGYPLLWPDGEVFGTICVLDVKHNHAAISYQNLIYQFKKVVDGDLKMLVEVCERKEAQAALLKIQKHLEARVENRTLALKETNNGLHREIARRKKTEAVLKQREAQLERKTEGLKDANIALRVLLENKESSKRELEKSMLANINELVLPNLHKLKRMPNEALNGHYVRLIEAGLSDITSSFSSDLLQKYSNLTPTEMQVINLIRHGKKTKEIADCLHTATSTVDFHRANIRQKLGLKGRRVNLQSHFQSHAWV